MSGSSQSESHLFLFWKHPAQTVDGPLASLRQRFQIRSAVQLHWRAELFDNNIQRFYAMLPEQARAKREEFSEGPFLLVICEDPAPSYRLRVSGGSGFKRVNINTFDLKQSLRRDGFFLHATNTVEEFRRDVMLLTGKPAADLPTNFEPWDGKLGDLHSDIVGSAGWRSLSEIFSVLNETVTYVVLRNFEKLPDEHLLGPHDDVDLLLEDSEHHTRAAATLGIREDPWVNVGDRKIYFDLRSVEGCYYDPRWSRDILKNRVTRRGFYVPNDDDYFFSLLYHGHIQKKAISTDYVPRLVALAQRAGILGITEDSVRQPGRATALIGDYLRGQGYCLTRPHGIPEYNLAAASLVSGVPTVYHHRINLYEEMAAARPEPAPAPMTIASPTIRQRLRPWVPDPVVRTIRHLRNRGEANRRRISG